MTDTKQSPSLVRRYWPLAATLICSVIIWTPYVLWGQSANVIALTPEEADQAQQIAKALRSAERADSAFRYKLLHKYVLEEVNGGSEYSLKVDGWNYWGIEYSDDFKFIVPAQVPAGVSSGIENLGPVRQEMR